MIAHLSDPFTTADEKPMLRLAFSESDQHALNYERYHHPHPRVQQRMEALWLKSQGLAHQQIAHLCHISGNTLRAYLKWYQSGGVQALKVLPFHRPESAFMKHRALCVNVK
jgi:Homeodomain-like domain